MTRRAAGGDVAAGLDGSLLDLLGYRHGLVDADASRPRPSPDHDHAPMKGSP